MQPAVDHVTRAPPQRRTRILIVGGAIMGSAVAHSLLSHAAADRARAAFDITIIERDPSYRACATTRSAGGLRQQFSTPESIAMSLAGLALVRNLQATFGADADVTFREQGYLMLAAADRAGILAGNVSLQRRHGADIALLDPEALARRFPWLSTDGVACGAFGESGEGWLDPASLLALFQRSARDKGARYLAGEVAAIEVADASAVAVCLADGRRIACDRLVICAGPQSGRVAAMAGIELPVRPLKRFVFSFDGRDLPADLGRAPLTIDPAGVWFRPEGRQFICGVSPTDPADEPAPDDLDLIDHDLFATHIWPVLATRVPAFTAIKATGAWAGHYDDNAFDHNAVIGPHPAVANVVLCTGFSGHGLQHAAAAGRAVAELLIDGGYRTLDLSRLGFARLLRGEPLRELSII